MEKRIKKKLKYVAPQISVEVIEMENGIANSSANVNSPSESGEVKDEWETGPDNNQTIEW